MKKQNVRSVPQERAVEAPATRAESMASEPSEADIRMRAYWRFLERGGTHGMDFDDWLSAESESKEKSHE
jgi:hypothetical protein